MTDYRALIAAAPGNDLKQVAPFDIPVTFAHPTNAWSTTIKNFMFTEDSWTSDTDTTDIKQTITGIASHVTNKPS